MIEAIATVVGMRDGLVSVEYKRTSACGHCENNSSCSIKAEGEHAGEHIIDIACSLSLEIGQQVRIGIPENELVKGALLIYILPLFFIMLGAILGQYFAPLGDDWPAIEGAFLGGCIGFMLMRIRSSRLSSEEYKPVILGVNIPVIQMV
ncbi:SoxR reducing system RseC family protein [Tolumonas lignilytica]|uniref:SoxR reducing system RseC family protein n=1 Tax=Tolumonas lignilytica TaxID=1283284 RepID=UPI0004664E11|nr:SoxR reducing system RseC family protein [Tolumonas lignilytica]